MSTAIVWFRRDLRLADNPALYAAAERHEEVLPLYVHAPDEEAPWQPGAASRWWLHWSLNALGETLHSRGGSLHLAAGDSLETLIALCRRHDVSAVYWNRLYEPAAIARDTQIKAALLSQGIEAHSFNAALWREPWQVSTKQSEPYRVFTPFWRNLRTQIEPSQPLPEPSPRWMVAEGSRSQDALRLLPRIPWHVGMQEAWRPGEHGAAECLDLFMDDALGDYARLRDVPARHGTSRLSPHLHFGDISPRQIWHALHQRHQRVDARRRPDIEPYLRELGWREFAHHLLFHYPATPAQNFQSGFDRFAWAEPEAASLERWQRGMTGIPLVDAGMRELWHTGWMHNRVRMIVASFLTKNLRLHWSHGARWFWDTLVDADLANNTLGWQWVAGCGADAAPYFRVFNPVTQGLKFDPQGEYLRRWLPELSALPAPLIHEPWKEPARLRQSGYPTPMVDLADSRQQALSAYRQSREAR